MSVFACSKTAPKFRPKNASRCTNAAQRCIKNDANPDLAKVPASRPKFRPKKATRCREFHLIQLREPPGKKRSEISSKKNTRCREFHLIQAREIHLIQNTAAQSWSKKGNPIREFHLIQLREPPDADLGAENASTSVYPELATLCTGHHSVLRFCPPLPLPVTQRGLVFHIVRCLELVRTCKFTNDKDS